MSAPSADSASPHSLKPGSRHLLALDGMSADAITNLLDRAERFVSIAQRRPTEGRHASDALRGTIIAMLFLEDSTRTRGSFTVAAQRLGADVLTLTGAGSSLSKGETLLDTVRNLEAMGVDAIVMRCAASGGAVLAARGARVPLINAGDGNHEHPTQGLLDLLTMRRRFGGLRDKRVAIVGDIANSRVARSALHGLTTVGAHVLLIGPEPMAPPELAQIIDPDRPGSVQVHHALDPHLAQLDAIMMLRVQFERGSAISDDYRETFSLTAQRASQLPAYAIILHPGPINRGLEIESAVADDPERSVILEQVTNGVAVRMAVLEWALGSADR